MSQAVNLWGRFRIISVTMRSWSTTLRQSGCRLVDDACVLEDELSCPGEIGVLMSSELHSPAFKRWRSVLATERTVLATKLAEGAPTEKAVLATDGAVLATELAEDLRRSFPSAAQPPGRPPDNTFSRLATSPRTKSKGACCGSTSSPCSRKRLRFCARPCTRAACNFTGRDRLPVCQAAPCIELTASAAEAASPKFTKAKPTLSAPFLSHGTYT
mmetsp:Transcript_15634/g.45118  ORF Transcript_15634/g.45118 Transcript_15634/m.45118 type:complete len:215 (-) Transcript_15634:196-840(-)